MMDRRKALPEGTILEFQGISCKLGPEIGRGSNALVYEASYRDAHENEQIHRVLVKELFPLDPAGRIYREGSSILVDPEADTVFRMHRDGFEAGNRAHLSLLETSPEQIGANLNTYSLNGTLYTVLGVSGGESLATLQGTTTCSLRLCAMRMLAILDALEIFHKNGVVHLDIAPDNILMISGKSSERALLIDYNSTMQVVPWRADESVVFSVKQGYTAPEVRRGLLREIGFHTDLYSVTAVFYWLLTGTSLTNFQMIRPAPPDVSTCACLKDEPDTVKAMVQEILKRGLQSVPRRRYQTVQEMREDLEELLERIDRIVLAGWISRHSIVSPPDDDGPVAHCTTIPEPVKEAGEDSIAEPEVQIRMRNEEENRSIEEKVAALMTRTSRQDYDVEIRTGPMQWCASLDAPQGSYYRTCGSGTDLSALPWEKAKERKSFSYEYGGAKMEYILEKEGYVEWVLLETYEN